MGYAIRVLDKKLVSGDQSKGVILNTSDFIDKLRRAEQMEEEMAGRLVVLCHPEALAESISADSRTRIKSCLETIRLDTQRHARIVSEMISQMSGEQNNG